MPTNILIIGATGNIGYPITEQIIAAKSSFGRIAILTSKNTVSTKEALIKSWKEKGVEVIVGDVTAENDVKKAYEGGVVFIYIYFGRRSI